MRACPYRKEFIIDPFRHIHYNHLFDCDHQPIKRYVLCPGKKEGHTPNLTMESSDYLIPLTIVRSVLHVKAVETHTSILGHWMRACKAVLSLYASPASATNCARRVCLEQAVYFGSPVKLDIFRKYP